MHESPKTRYSLIGKLHDPQNLEAWNEFASIYQVLIFRICRQRGVLARVAKLEGIKKRQAGR